MSPRPMDDFTATPTPRPVSIPINSPPKDGPVMSDSSSNKVSDNVSLSDTNASISESISNELSASPSDSKDVNSGFTSTSSLDASSASDTVAKSIPVSTEMPSTADKATETEPLIPGLNAKPAEDAFKDTPVTLTDTSEAKVPDISDNTDEKLKAGSVTSAQIKPVKKKGKGMAIVVAIILAIALIAGAGYAYMQNSKKTTPPVENKTTVTAPAKSPATSADIDALNTEIDNTLKKVDDTKDYQESDLSDTTLGL